MAIGNDVRAGHVVGGGMLGRVCERSEETWTADAKRVRSQSPHSTEAARAVRGAESKTGLREGWAGR